MAQGRILAKGVPLRDVFFCGQRVLVEKGEVLLNVTIP